MIRELLGDASVGPPLHTQGMALRTATASAATAIIQAGPSQDTPKPSTPNNSWLAVLQALPNSLLGELVGQHMDSDSQLQLFKVCKTLRNLVLKHSNCTELILDLFSTPASKAIKALHLACELASNVYLRLSWGEPYGHHGRTKAQRSQALTQGCLQLLETAYAERALTAVTSLQLMGADAHMLLQPDKAHLFTQLHRLQLDQVVISDSNMEVLLSLPCLTHLGVGRFKLRRSYVGRPCTWLSITCSALRVKTLTRLPLNKAAELKVQRFGPDDQDSGLTVLGIPPGTTKDTCAQAVGNVANCRGIVWEEGVEFGVGCDDWGGTALAEMLVLCLPLMVNAPGLNIHHVHLTSAVMPALGEHVSTKKRLGLMASCVWEEEVGLWLVSCMPEDSELRVFIESEEQLTKLCCAAKRPLTLYPAVEGFETRLTYGWRGRIKAAMQRCGHQYVTIPYLEYV